MAMVRPHPDIADVDRRKVARLCNCRRVFGNDLKNASVPYAAAPASLSAGAGANRDRWLMTHVDDVHDGKPSRRLDETQSRPHAGEMRPLTEPPRQCVNRQAGQPVPA
jgi:hypothetical protein